MMTTDVNDSEVFSNSGCRPSLDEGLTPRSGSSSKEQEITSMRDEG